MGTTLIRVGPCPAIVKVYVTLILLLSSNVLLADSLFKECNRARADSTAEFVPIKKVQPVYPVSALRSEKQGWVDVRFTVMPDGSTANQQVAKSYPDKTFNAAAVAAVRKFRFEPARKNGVPVATPNVTNRVMFRVVDHQRKINSALRRVRMWLSEKKYGHAIGFLDRELAHERTADPFSAYVATLRYLKGVTLELHGDVDGALSSFVSMADLCKKMCPLSPELSTAMYIQTGNIYASRRQWQQSVDYYRRALGPYVYAQHGGSHGKSPYAKPNETVIGAYANYAVAAMNLGDWCSSEHGFASAISAAKEQSMHYPDMWQKGLELMRQQLSNKAQAR